MPKVVDIGNSTSGPILFQCFNGCTYQTCPDACLQINYEPNLGVNSFFLAFFAVLLVAQGGLGYYYRTWGFTIGMACGLILEIAGYVGRILLHNNPFNFTSFLIYLICLTIGPAFLTAAIYLCLSRIVVVYGQGLSRLQPRILSLLFMTSDLIALILQASGGALSSTAKSKTSSNTGRYIMIAGLVWQVVSIIIFMAIWLDFSWTVSRATEDEKSHNEKLRSLRADSKRFKYFQWALWTATILILIRSIYRVVELQGGYTGTVASDEPSFIVLEGVLIVLAVILLTVLHPAYAFGGQWDSATWSLTGKTIEAEYAPVSPTELRTIKVQSV